MAGTGLPGTTTTSWFVCQVQRATIHQCFAEPFPMESPSQAGNLPSPQPSLILLPKRLLLPHPFLLLEVPLQMCKCPGCSPEAVKPDGRSLGMGETLTLKRQATGSRTISELLSDSSLVSPQEAPVPPFSHGEDT